MKVQVMPKPPEKVSIRGLAIPSEWDKNGQVLGVTIKTFDEDEYVVADIEAIKELLTFLKKEVVVKGAVKFSEDKKFLYLCKLKK